MYSSSLFRFTSISPCIFIQTSCPCIGPLKLLHSFFFFSNTFQEKTFFSFLNKPGTISTFKVPNQLTLQSQPLILPQLLVCFQISIPLICSLALVFASYHPCSPRCVMPSPLAMHSKFSIVTLNQKISLSQTVSSLLLMVVLNVKSSSNSQTLVSLQLMKNLLTWTVVVLPT